LKKFFIAFSLATLYVVKKIKIVFIKKITERNIVARGARKRLLTCFDI